MADEPTTKPPPPDVSALLGKLKVQFPTQLEGYEDTVRRGLQHMADNLPEGMDFDAYVAQVEGMLANIPAPTKTNDPATRG